LVAEEDDQEESEVEGEAEIEATGFFISILWKSLISYILNSNKWIMIF